MLNRISVLVNQNVSFGIETSLATRSYRQLIQKAHSLGYKANYDSLRQDTNQTILLLMKKIGLGSENTEQSNTATGAEKLFKGAQLAIRNAVEKAKRDNQSIVISRNGKPTRVKARDL